MSTAPSGQDVSAPYTTEALVKRWLPTDYKTSQAEGAGPSNQQGYVSVDDIADIIKERSRQIDGRMWSAGMRTPFPAVTATNPQLPMQIRLAVSYLVAADICAIIKLGSRGAPDAEDLEERAEAILTALEKKPRSIGWVLVTSPELFQAQAGVGTRESGLLQSFIYRTANPDIDPASLRFVKSDGTEVFRASGLPYQYGVDFKVLSAAEGTFAIANLEILNQIGANGGITYRWSWVRADRHGWVVSPLRGVGR